MKLPRRRQTQHQQRTLFPLLEPPGTVKIVEGRHRNEVVAILAELLHCRATGAGKDKVSENESS